MQKFFSHSLIAVVMIALVAGAFFVPEIAYAQEAGDSSFVGQAVMKIQERILTSVADTMLRLAGFVTWIAAWMLNFSLDVSVINMKTHVDGLEALDVGWKAFRDLANMFFIFILLYISIATILRLEGYNARALLAKVIIVALLINFSLFFTKVIIDASNRLALEFYSATGIEQKVDSRQPWNNGFAESLMTATKVQTIYSMEGGVAAGGSGVLTGASAREGGVADVLTKPVELFTLAAAGSVFLLVLAFVFFAASILLVGRFIILVILMVLSPLAYMAMILPSTRGLAHRWWKTLVDQAIFAPVYLMLTWFSLHVVNSEGFNGLSRLRDNETFVNAFVGRSPEIILNYAMVIGFLIASLVIAKSSGTLGAGTVMKWGTAAQKWGQGVVSRGALGGGRLLGRAATYAPRELTGAASKSLGKLYGDTEARIKRSESGKAILKTAAGIPVVGTALGQANRAAKNTLEAGQDLKAFGSTSYRARRDDLKAAEKEDREKVQKTIRGQERDEAIEAVEALGDIPDIIDRVQANTASTDELAAYNRLEEVLRKMSSEELKKAKTKDLKKIAGVLADNQMKIIDGDAERADADKQEIWDERFKKLTDGIKSGNVDAVEAALKSRSDADLEHLPIESLTNDVFLGALNSKRTKKILDSDRYTDSAKAQIKQTRLRSLETTFDEIFALDDEAEQTRRIRSVTSEYGPNELAQHLDTIVSDFGAIADNTAASTDDRLEAAVKIRKIAQDIPTKILKAGIEEMDETKVRARIRATLESDDIPEDNANKKFVTKHMDGIMF